MAYLTRFRSLALIALGSILGYLAATGGFELAPSIGADRPAATAALAGASCCESGLSKELLLADASQEIQLAQAQAKAAQQGKAAQPSGKKPNIVFIMGDDVGWFNIGAYHRGIMSGKTPNLDKLASQGMLFTDYYAEA